MQIINLHWEAVKMIVYQIETISERQKNHAISNFQTLSWTFEQAKNLTLST